SRAILFAIPSSSKSLTNQKDESGNLKAESDFPAFIFHNSSFQQPVTRVFHQTEVVASFLVIVKTVD
ncbi:MAG TPA: hypothetical protein VJQ48_09765, partial [Candidatus Binatia bacterium]|nr:hypothetical protein [Candidatus Binatia bacterium]